MAAVKTHYGIQVQAGGPGVFEQVRETFQERELSANTAGNQIASVPERNCSGLSNVEAPLAVGSLDYNSLPVTTSGHPNFMDTNTGIGNLALALHNMTA